MPPFEYRGYQNPYVQSMSALLQQPGQIEAQRAMTVAQAQAQAAQQSGQAWAGAANQIGQQVGQIPQEIAAAKMNALKAQDIQGQIAERNQRAQQMQRDAAATAAGEAAIKASVNPETGAVDHDKAASLWEQAGVPTQANANRESVQKTAVTAQQLTEGQQKIQAGQQQVQQAAANHLGELGAAGLQKIQDGATPQEVRDYTMGLVANAASHGLIQPDAAKQMLMQSAQAGPDQLAPIYQKLLDGAPEVKSRLIAEDLKKAETAKNLAEAERQRAEANAGPKPSAEQDTMRATALRAQVNLGQQISREDAAWLKSHETEKTLGVDLTAGMAANRQAKAIDAATAQQSRAQNFQEQQQGRKELTEKVEQPYQTAASSAQTLRDTVSLAKSGNMSAAALQNLETTMAAIRAQGLNRINTTEIGSTANAGSLWDRAQSFVGKVTAGQPVDAALQKDMQQFAGMLEKAAYKKYLDGQTSVTKRYNLTDEKALPGPTIYARDTKGVLHAAPYGQKLPTGWTEE